jgi:sugar phosphate isomerase/epimerase
MFAQKSGFDGIELAINQNFDTQNPAYLKTLEKRYKMPIKAFSIGRKQEENLFEIFQSVVKEFPETTINLYSSEILSFKYKNWLEKIVPRLAKKYHLQFNRKNAPFKLVMGILPSRSENSLYALREAGKVCLDLSALWSSREEIMRTIDFLGEKLRHVYLSNVYHNISYFPPQQGVLPLESFLTKLQQNKFPGSFTIKISPKNLREGDDTKVESILTDAQEFWAKYFKS